MHDKEGGPATHTRRQHGKTVSPCPPYSREGTVVHSPDGHDKVMDAVVLAVDHQLRDHLAWLFVEQEEQRGRRVVIDPKR